MLPKLFLVKTHPINVTNLFIGMLINEIDTKLYYPCHYEIMSNGFIRCIDGITALTLVSNPSINLRNTVWQNNIINLEEVLNKANKSNQSVIIGTHHNNQIEFLKNHFGSDCFTIGINYNENLYQYLLSNFVNYHLYLLDTGLIEMNDTDKQITTNRYEWYYKEFDKNNLIPKSSTLQCDYNILIDDFFHLDRMQKHFFNIGISLNDTGYYQSWVESAKL